MVENDFFSPLKWLLFGTGRFVSNGMNFLAFVRTQAKFFAPDIQCVCRLNYLRLCLSYMDFRIHFGAFPLVGGPADWSYDHSDFEAHAPTPHDERGYPSLR